MVRRQSVFEKAHLFGDSFWGSGVIAGAINWLGAPVAMIGAAAAGYHIEGKITMSPQPSISIALSVNHIPRWKRQLIEAGHQLPWLRSCQIPCDRIQIGQTRDCRRILS